MPRSNGMFPQNYASIYPGTPGHGDQMPMHPFRSTAAVPAWHRLPARRFHEFA